MELRDVKRRLHQGEEEKEQHVLQPALYGLKSAEEVGRV
jgi:hypothetical protein